MAIDERLISSVNADLRSFDDGMRMCRKCCRIDEGVDTSSLDDPTIDTPECLYGAEEEGRDGREYHEKEHIHDIAWLGVTPSMDE